MSSDPDYEREQQDFPDEHDEQLDILRDQILNFESDKRRVDPDSIKQIYDKALKDRSLFDYQ